MGTFETYSKRQKRLAGEDQIEVYKYDELPQPFRVQVSFIWSKAVGPYVQMDRYSTSQIPISNSFWKNLHEIIAEEIGVYDLASNNNSYSEKCRQFFLKANTAHALDIIEMSFKMINEDIWRNLGQTVKNIANISIKPDDAIATLNHRFREHSLGYQFVGGEIIKKNSELLHQEAVVVALNLLKDEEFVGALDEFHQAYEHYRKGNYKEAIITAENAFESTMKHICTRRNWTFDPDKHTAVNLLQIIVANGLVPEYLREVLLWGLPRVRNKTSGHGQGVDLILIPDNLAAYSLHLTGSNIVLLIQAYKTLP